MQGQRDSRNQAKRIRHFFGLDSGSIHDTVRSARGILYTMYACCSKYESPSRLDHALAPAGEKAKVEKRHGKHAFADCSLAIWHSRGHPISIIMQADARQTDKLTCSNPQSSI